MRKILAILFCLVMVTFTANAAIGDQFSVDGVRIDGSGNIIAENGVNIDGSLLLDVMYVSYNSTLTVTQSGLVISTGTAAFTLWLPTAVGNAGLTYTIKLDSSTATGVAVYAVTIDGYIAETIDGETSNNQIDAWYDFMTVTSNGDEWVITGIDTGM